MRISHNRFFQTLTRLQLLVAACLVLTVTVAAHVVVTEQFIAVDARLTGGQLHLEMHVPLGAVPDATLPRTDSGSLAPDADPATVQVVAADAVRNLDLRQDDRSVRAPTFTAVVSTDRTALDIVADVTTDSTAGLSLRLNTFQGERLTPVVSILTVHTTNGDTRTMRISGPSTRVLLTPDVGDTLGRFVADGVRQVLTWSEPALLLLCLLATHRTIRDAGRLVGLLLAGQVIGLAVYGVSGGALTTAVPVVAMLATSGVTMAALQLVVRARSSYVMALGIGVGVLAGFTLAHPLAQGVPFAGGHVALAIGSYLLSLVVTQLWLAGIVFATRGWLAERGVSERVVSYGVAALVVHTTIHHFFESGIAFEGSGAFLGQHALTLVTLAWAVLMLALAAVEAVRTHPRSGADLEHPRGAQS